MGLGGRAYYTLRRNQFGGQITPKWMGFCHASFALKRIITVHVTHRYTQVILFASSERHSVQPNFCCHRRLPGLLLFTMGLDLPAAFGLLSFLCNFLPGGEMGMRKF